jgi:hypothetical protein
MLRTTLIAQLLSFVLESQGVDLDALRERFPDEFDPGFNASLAENRRGHDSPGVSPGLNQSLRFLLARNVIEITPLGSLWVPPAAGSSTHEWFSPAFEDGRGARPVLTRRDLDVRAPAEHADRLDFDQPRLEG